MAHYAAEKEIPFLNLNTVLDGEAHINIIQAENVTKAVGEYLTNMYEVLQKAERTEAVQESFEYSAELFQSYYDKCELLSVNNFEQYWEFAKKTQYLTILCKSYSENDSTGKIIVMDGGDTIVEEIVTIEQSEMIEKTLDIQGKTLQLSAGTDTSILIDGLDYSMHTKGYNLVLYDKVLGEFVEMVSFDECDNMNMKRK